MTRVEPVVKKPEMKVYTLGRPCTTTPSSENKSTQTEDSSKESKYEHVCTHCDIHFGDEMMYLIHLGLHTRDDPYLCNICGCSCKDRFAFYTHLVRNHN
jgi:IKAROS family zinc finger protein